MQTVMMISGMPGIGKTSLSKKIMERHKNLKLISLDEIKEELFEKYGFRDIKEKKVLEQLSFSLFYNELHISLIKGEDIITDYPFSHTREQDLIKNLSVHRDLNMFTLRLLCDHDIAFKRFAARERSLAHNAITYPLTCPSDLITYSFEKYMQENLCKESFELGQLLKFDITLIDDHTLESIASTVLDRVFTKG